MKKVTVIQSDAKSAARARVAELTVEECYALIKRTKATSPLFSALQERLRVEQKEL